MTSAALVLSMVMMADLHGSYRVLGTPTVVRLGPLVTTADGCTVREGWSRGRLPAVASQCPGEPPVITLAGLFNDCVAIVVTAGSRSRRRLVGTTWFYSTCGGPLSAVGNATLRRVGRGLR